jgi:PilZ domain
MSSTNPTESNNAAIASPAERRRNLRFPFSATVEAIEPKSGTKVTGRTSDLGLGGCYVDTLSPFPVGTEATIRILRQNESFEAQAKVVYSLIGMGMGLAFVSAQPKQVRLFQRWLLEISGKVVPAKETSEQDEVKTHPAEKTQTMKYVVLSDLIMTLMQKKVLTEAEGKDLLRKLFQ